MINNFYYQALVRSGTIRICSLMSIAGARPPTLPIEVAWTVAVPPAEINRVVPAKAVIGDAAVTARAGSKIAAPVSTARIRDLKRP